MYVCMHHYWGMLYACLKEYVCISVIICDVRTVLLLVNICMYICLYVCMYLKEGSLTSDSLSGLSRWMGCVSLMEWGTVDSTRSSMLAKPMDSNILILSFSRGLLIVGKCMHSCMYALVWICPDAMYCTYYIHTSLKSKVLLKTL